MTKSSRDRRKNLRSLKTGLKEVKAIRNGTLPKLTLNEAICASDAHFKRMSNQARGLRRRSKEELEASRCSAYEYLIP